jgi:hypothetical protein
MLSDANQLASQLSGQGSMWQKPFAHPEPRVAVERASAWFTAYPLSFIPARDFSPGSPTPRCGVRSRRSESTPCTGKGADFRLAEIGYAEYPGMYHMVAIDPQEWDLLPDVPAGVDSVNLDASAEHRLARAGDIIGELQRDANGFLGVEKSAEDLPAWSEAHLLSEAANHLIASMVRKMGAFSFQELNLAIDDIKSMGESGADLSYDFVNRPAYHHALVTGDTEFLRLTLNTALRLGINPASLVHALQNHDELTFELVHFSTSHEDDVYEFARAEMTGAERVRSDLCGGLTGTEALYNRVFTTNGIACTTAGVIAAVLGICDPRCSERRTDRRDQARASAARHVQRSSAWRVRPVRLGPVRDADAARRRGCRSDRAGGHALDQSWRPRSQRCQPASDALERRPSGCAGLYGSLPEQLDDENSFAHGLRRILEVRRRHRLAIASQVDVPDVSHKAMLVLVHELPSQSLQITALNFSPQALTGTIRSEHLMPGARVTDMFSDEEAGFVDDLHSFSLELSGYGGIALLLHPPIASESASAP